MDVFQLRQELIQDYARYVGSFLALRDERIRERVEGMSWNRRPSTPKCRRAGELGIRTGA